MKVLGNAINFGHFWEQNCKTALIQYISTFLKILKYVVTDIFNLTIAVNVTLPNYTDLAEFFHVLFVFQHLP